jgi:porin
MLSCSRSQWIFIGFLLGAWIMTNSSVVFAQTVPLPAAVTKAGYATSSDPDRPNLGSPNTPPNLLLEDDATTQPIFRIPGIDEGVQPWYDAKGHIAKEYGLKFGLNYTTLSQKLSDSIGEEDVGSSAILRVYGQWDLVNRGNTNSGRLVFSVDHRHKMGADIPAADLASQAGYAGITAVMFSDIGLELIDFNWQQALGGDAGGGLIAGRFDPTDYLAVLGYANPWTAFSNVATLLNPSVAFPDASYGVGGGSWLGDQWYVKGAINDANGSLTNYEFFRDGAEFFKFAELGWSPTRGQRYSENYHVAIWHVDEREKVGIDSARGLMLGANWSTDDERWMWFARAGWSDGDAALYNETYTLGFMRKYRRNSDALGLAVNWGELPQNELRAQTTGELFYRLQLARNLAITPNLQLLKNPALNDEKDTVWVYGLRLRFTL